MIKIDFVLMAWLRTRWVITWGLLAMALPQAALAQPSYPNKAIRLVIAFGPGGVADTIGRLVGQKLNERFGQPVVVDNRPGAGGIVAAKLVAEAPADGYTLLVITSAVAINAVTSKEGVDPRHRLTPIALAASALTVLATHNSVTTRNLLEYVRNAKAGRFSYSTAGVGTAEHLTSEYIFKMAGLDATHVPFPGGLAAVTAVLGKHVEIVTTPVPSAWPFIKDGRLRAAAVASHTRIPLLPDVPTLGETGFTNFENATWVAVFAPPNLREGLVQTLNSEINNALVTADVRDRLTTLGFDQKRASQGDFANYIKDEMEKWSRVVKTTGITLN